MFRLTADIFFSGIAGAVKPTAVSWSRSVDNFSDTATIKLPSVCRLKREADSYAEFKAIRSQTALQFREGMTVKVYAGYNGENDLRFSGFVRRVRLSVPVEIECEGYTYPLRKKVDFSKAYKNTTVRKILEDVVAGTGIKLSDDIPHVPIEKVTFQNISGLQVLEWFKQKCLLTVNFNHDTLYVGLRPIQPRQTVKFSLGWNVINDNDLTFEDNKELADVRVEIGGKQKDGTLAVEVFGQKDGQSVKLGTLLRDPDSLKAIAEQQKRSIVNRGYEGSMTTFLQPFCEPGMGAEIDDMKYPERKGRYLITGIDGDFSSAGGRQKIKIGYSLGNG
jgi:hypothetical protein